MRQDNSSFSKSYLRQDLNHVLRTRQTLYQLSHRGSSAGQAESLNVFQGQRRLFPDKQGNSFQYCSMYTFSELQAQEVATELCPLFREGYPSNTGQDNGRHNVISLETHPPPHTHNLHMHTCTSLGMPVRANACPGQCLLGPMAVRANACPGQCLYCMYIRFV